MIINHNDILIKEGEGPKTFNIVNPTPGRYILSCTSDSFDGSVLVDGESRQRPDNDLEIIVHFVIGEREPSLDIRFYPALTLVESEKDTPYFDGGDVTYSSIKLKYLGELTNE